MPKIKEKILISLSIMAFSWLVLGLETQAQTAPQILATWQANSYAPAGYQGKILPTRGSKVDLAVSLIDKGKVADLARREIRWFFNNDLIAGGLGLAKTDFTVPFLTPAGNQILKVQIINYLGNNLEKTFSFPVTDPEIVIDAPYADNKISLGSNLFTGLPYFFNITDISQLEWSWSANGLSAQKDAVNNVLELDVSGGKIGDQLILTASAINRLRQRELASETLILKIK